MYLDMSSNLDTLLITGGTGSLGRAVAKKLLTRENCPFRDLKIAVFSRDEHKQEQLAQELAPFDPYERMRYWLGDVRDKDRLQVAVNCSALIIHAAALKIVPTAEYNPFEYIKTNIGGSQNLIDCCSSVIMPPGYPKVLAVSTDKAVKPINLYGATKLTMEKMMLASNNVRGQLGPRFSVCRYGNVANSNGSVIKVFRKQLADGLPLTITDERMTRYWIELDEAADFVLQSLKDMHGGETFIPDMPSFKVLHLAEAIGGQHPIKIIGVRPGEKLHESIDENRTSNINTAWLSQDMLAEKLRHM